MAKKKTQKVYVIKDPADDDGEIYAVTATYEKAVKIVQEDIIGLSTDDYITCCEVKE